MELVTDLTLVVVAALVGGLLAQRLRQPLIVGYILAGIAVGPFTGGLTVTRIHDIEQLAEIGVALLLFSLGLEVSLRELAPVRAVALAGTTIQILLTLAFGTALASAFGWEWRPAVWFGAIASFSSTMVALKTLQAQGRIGTLSSRVMLGMLVVQDLAVVPLMIVLPELGTPGAGVGGVLLATGRAMLLLGAIVLVATRLVPRLLGAVARWQSRELFLLTTTAIALGVGYAAWSFGLSLAIGAFIAGLVVSESEYGHQALSDVGPLRDLFGMLFFVSVGMLLDPALVRAQAGVLAIVVIAIALGKGAILAGVVRAFRYRHVVPIATAFTLFQIGEFAFVLARAGHAAGHIPDDLYALVLNTAVVTMALTPLLSNATTPIYARFGRSRVRESYETSNLPGTGLTGHVIVAGGGRVGHTIAVGLRRIDVPCVIVELDTRRVARVRQDGLPVIFGDAAQPVVLGAAGLADARALIVTVPAFPAVRDIVAAVREARAELPIIARADGAEAIAALRAIGVRDVTSPEFEAAVEMTRQALQWLDVDPVRASMVTESIRADRYGVG